MKVNGHTMKLENPLSLKDFLESSGYTAGRIAVEYNGSIVPKTAYEKIKLSDSDTLEIVHFVGGG